MRRAVILLPLLLGGCSCERHPAADAPGAAATAATAVAEATGSTDAATVAPLGPAPLSAVAAGAEDEGIVVRHYLNALARGDHAAADAFWSGGRTASHADDAVLRQLLSQPEPSRVLSLRMDIEVPIARDQAQPSRLREVPVRIRVMTADGPLRYQGGYRLQPRPDASGWEIHGASVQPVLD
ncbi:hypothetical protein AB8E26_02425 [Stenotrophomonas rhizophila]|uniref:hypothetical protein n=1 Tax=Stenotrophomonas rhizophila TaxID=216778 RepID=UPI003518AFA3